MTSDRGRTTLASWVPPLVIALLLALTPAVGVAQRPDTAQRRDSVRLAPPLGALPARDTVKGPPISPRSALLRSLLVPGWGQLSLGRRWAAGLFIALEATSGMMAVEAKLRLDFARRYGQDSVLIRYEIPSAPNQPLRAVLRPGELAGREVPRRQHLEDWLALLAFNHLLSAVDAYIAAHLWDLPAQVSIRGSGDGAIVAAQITW